jgi:malate/lactate dehydrogenase
VIESGKVKVVGNPCNFATSFGVKYLGFNEISNSLSTPTKGS